MTLTCNVLILILILTDFHLHTPMYFFLGNLAFLDICFLSVTAPCILFDLHTQKLRISKTACISQIFFIIIFISSEACLLAMMSCDRYVAICHPLCYMQIMQWKVCTHIAFGVWITGIIYSMVHTLCTLRLNFCGSNVIHSFFCDLSQLLRISCTDASINNMLIFVLGGIYALSFSVLTFFPYVNIFRTVLRIQTKNKRLKAFSTCASHLTMVFLLYGTTALNYFCPNDGKEMNVDFGTAHLTHQWGRGILVALEGVAFWPGISWVAPGELVAAAPPEVRDREDWWQLFPW
ncbi:olfactory receptor 1C1-like [Discoglossus pictus]